MPKNPIEQIIKAKSIAIVGASRSVHKVGYQLLKNLIDGNYEGEIYPVNPNATTILGLRTYPSLSDLPHVPELVIIITPAPIVIPIVTEAKRLGCQFAIVISAGFSESGKRGQELQYELVKLIQDKSIRILGPNCLGTLSPVYQLNAAFGPSLPKPGTTMLISQSGALVTGILDWMSLYGLGLSHAITLGNRCDISENDCLEFALKDRHTKQILIYIESFSDAPGFFSLASKITPYKPIILLKGGSTKAGQTASQSHTAALASDQVLIRAFANQTGVTLRDTYSSWLQTATYFSQTPPFKGNAVSVITNAGGPGVLVADALSNTGMSIAPFSKSTLTALSTSLPLTSVSNPLDLLGDAPPERYSIALELVKKNFSTDTLIIIMTPQTSTKPAKAAEAIAGKLQGYKKPVAIILIGGSKLKQAGTILRSSGIPVFTYPDEAVKAIATKAHYDLTKHQLRVFPKSYSPKKHYSLPFQPHLSTLFSLLKEYDFTLPRYSIIDSLYQIPEALSHVGRPAVAKTAGLRIPHKAKVGGVILNIMTTDAMRIAYRQLTALDSEVLIQQTVHGQCELIIGAKRDPQLGVFVTSGLGGSLTNALDDRCYVFTPAHPNSFVTAFKKTKAYQACSDQELAVEHIPKAMEILGRILADHPEIQEMEINPAIVTKKQLYVADIKVTMNED